LRKRTIVTVRIETSTEGSTTIINVDGRLTQLAVEQLRKTCGPIKGAVVLDLSNLQFADDAGIDAIRAMVSHGATVRGASQFVELLLDDDTREESDGKE